MTKAALTKPSPLTLALEDRFQAFLVQLEATMAEEKTTILAWLEHVKANVQVTDADSLEAALEVARLAKGRLDSLEADRGLYSKPLHIWKGMVDGVFKGLSLPLAEVIKTAKDRMGEYGARKAQERAAIMAASAAEHSAGGTLTAIIPEPAQAKGLTLKIRWVATVVDPDQVPRDLCSPDPAKIADRIAYADTATRPPQPIPGLEFNLDTQATIRKG